MSDDNGSLVYKIVSGATMQKEKERKHKTHISGTQKKPRADEGKCTMDFSRKRRSKANFVPTRTSKLYRKHISADHGASASGSKEGIRTKSVDIQLKDELIAEEAEDPSHQPQTEKNVDGTVTCKYHVPGEVQVVDRVLGCRVQGDNKSSCEISLTLANDLPSEDLSLPDKKNRVAEDKPDSDKILDGETAEDFTEGLQNIISRSDESLEWNEEQTEEQGGAESPPVLADDPCAQSSEKKEDNPVNGTEESEWGRLLRLRWEKYQTENDAALGRGKHQKKAVSYRDAYASYPSEILSESGSEEEPEPEPEPDPEPEPEPEYTPAGKALKEKFARLRARQKEHLAQRNVKETFAPIDGLSGPESLPQVPLSNSKDGEQVTKLVQPVENAPMTELDDNKCGQILEEPNSKTDSTSRKRKISKHEPSGHLGIPVQSLGHHSFDIVGPSDHVLSTICSNSVPNNDLLPALGLCAPNANRMESSQKKISRSYSRQSRKVMRREIPFRIASCSGTSNEIGGKDHESNLGKFKLPDTSTEAFQQLKNSNPDNYILFCPQSCQQEVLGVLKIQDHLSLTSKNRWSCPNYVLMRSCSLHFHFRPEMCPIPTLT